MIAGHYNDNSNVLEAMNWPGIMIIQLYMQLPTIPYETCVITTVESRNTSAEIML